jgi:hypothetical protein
MLHGVRVAATEGRGGGERETLMLPGAMAVASSETVLVVQTPRRVPTARAQKAIAPTKFSCCRDACLR